MKENVSGLAAGTRSKGNSGKKEKVKSGADKASTKIPGKLDVSFAYETTSNTSNSSSKSQKLVSAYLI